VTLIAVIYIIYAGFQIMTGGGDEEKMKKSRNTILYVFIGIVIMWLAYALVTLVMTALKKTAYDWGSRSFYSYIIPDASAAVYSESEIDTFGQYKNSLRVSIENLEAEYKLNKSVSTTSIQNIKSLLQSAYERLPDTGDVWADNDSMKRAVDNALDIAMRNTSSTNYISDAISKVATFINSAKISTITGNITATPTEWNAPLSVTLRADSIVDPSGTTPGTNNYIWWMRENGGVRRELGRGPSILREFPSEGTFTIFLDVVSGSRNRRWRTDVLPLIAEKQIQVRPKLGEVILLVNGVNVTNLPRLKMNPSIAKMGVLFDATASRALSNGSIVSTTWDFGNENILTYAGSPLVERQIYTNQWEYTVKLEFKTNDGQSFSKNIQLIVRDPSAVIKIDRDVGNVGDEINMSALSYFANSNNIDYSWQIQDENNKKVVKSGIGSTFKYKFDAIGTYIVTMTARSPSGKEDADSRTITIESREPVINLDTPLAVNSESPNVITFDASKSYDPDTMSRKWLNYTWKLDGEKVTLDDIREGGARGTMIFGTKGKHTISLTVNNSYGKSKTVEREFEVKSVLDVGMLITPRVAPLGSIVNLIGRSENAEFFGWNTGDSTPEINGAKKVIQHIFAKTGIYEVTLTASTSGGDSNQVKRKIYVTDTNAPFALIDITNNGNTSYEDTTACGGSGAIVVNRSDQTTIDGSKSINIDGQTSNLSYTWNYFGKTKTTPILSEKFSELGCFPIKLTVRSAKNGSTHTSTQYVSIRNQPPELTGLSTTVDASKKDSQKVLVKVSANGAQDPDGVITSYIWFYTTESEREPQNVQITQRPEITFVLPNITEKYYFWVILEDNDGTRKNSMESGSDQIPLILDNQNANIYMPLISLTVPKTTVYAGEKVDVSAEAKTIVGTSITKNAEYAWDFDGDGKFDEKSTVPRASHIYKNSGTYSLRVRVTNNGVSNTKYQTIYVKNILKASARGYALPNGDIYLINTSAWVYDKSVWNLGADLIESPYAVRIARENVGTGDILGTLTVSSNNADIDSADLQMSIITSLSASSGSSVQSYPEIIDKTIHIASAGDRILLSMLGNTATSYVIDSDTSIDSDLDGIPDNDIDNVGTPSYTDGSVYVIRDFEERGKKTRTMKIVMKSGNEIMKSENITIVFDYITTPDTVSGESRVSLGSGTMSEYDQKLLDSLASLIRGTNDTDRIILMKDYATMVENWGDSFAKARSLIDLQERVNSLSISEEKKTEFSRTIDGLLVGDAQSTDEINLATKVIEWLIPTESPNRQKILDNLAMIASHPQSLAENKVLAQEILSLVKTDASISDKYKIHIKNQLLIILSGGQSSVSPTSVDTTEQSIGWGILGFIGWVVKVFLIIIGVILLVLLIGFIIYRLTRKSGDIGFQDFLIDSVFHSKRSPWEEAKIPVINDAKNIIITPPVVTPVVAAIPETKSSDILASYTPPVQSSPDPLTSYTRPVETQVSPIETPSMSDTSAQNTDVPDWLKVVTPPASIKESISQSIDPLSPVSQDPLIESIQTEDAPVTSPLPPASDVPDWLKVATTEIATPVEDSLGITDSSSASLDPLTPTETVDITTGSSDRDTWSSDQTEISPPSIPPASDVPDWLRESMQSRDASEVTPTEPIGESTEPKKTKKKVPKAPQVKKEVTEVTPAKIDSSTPSDTSSIPDWLK
jgi:PKD repeat protein